VLDNRVVSILHHVFSSAAIEQFRDVGPFCAILIDVSKQF